MIWIKENKFLTVFFAVMLLGAGALTFLLISSQANYEEVKNSYIVQSQELNRLQSLTPFPDEANLRKMIDQKDQYVASVTQLQSNIAALQFPLEPMRPEAYQDLLKKTVDDAVQKAGPGVLPPRFYLGFDNYKTSPPKGEAAAQLARELKAIEWVVNTLLEAKVQSITEIYRVPIPEEGPETRIPAANNKAPVNKALIKTPFEISFVAEQGRMRSALNEIVNSKQQFFIIRSIQIKNEKEKGPPRDLPPINVSGTSAPAQKLQVIVGNEKLIVTVRIEMVNSATPPTK